MTDERLLVIACACLLGDHSSDITDLISTGIHYSGVGSVAAVAAMAATLFWPKKIIINNC